MGNLKQLALLTAAMMACANNYGKPIYDDRERSDEPKFFCGDCVNCPKGNKTFCKLANHKVTKNTPANKCKHFNQ